MAEIARRPEWEYLVWQATYFRDSKLRIKGREERVTGWVVSFNEGEPLIGLGTICDNAGAEGWELVSVTNSWVSPTVPATGGLQTTGLALFFKRPA